MDRRVLEEKINDALHAHGVWKFKLRQAVAAGKLTKPASEIARPDRCVFGGWLRDLEEDPEYANCPTYHEVKAAHQDLHSEAGRVAALLEAGEREKALEELEGPAFKRITTTLTQAATRWRMQA